MSALEVDDRSAAATRVPVLAAGAAVLALVLGVMLSGSTPQPAPVGLPDAGPGTAWAVPLLRLAQHLAAVTTVGALLLGLLPLRRGVVPPLPAVAVAAPALAWAASAGAAVVVGLSEAAGRPLSDVLRQDALQVYVEQIDTGRALLLTAVLALAVAVASPAVRTGWGRAILLAAALAALVPTLRTGHSATADEHLLAVVSVTVHVVAVVLWVGGLAALLVSRRVADRAIALPRFSALALVCFVAVAGSGAVTAWTRLPELSALWSTGYGALLLAKAMLLVGLGALGRRHRRSTLPAAVAGDGAAFRRLAGAEVALMAVVLGLAVALTRTSA